jgi:folate-binding protein YgfZ
MSEAVSPLPAEVLIVEGADAGSFMHGQFTSHVLSLREGHWQFSAWLDPQGRVRFLFHLARLAEERWALVLRGGSAEVLQHELTRYVFRAKVKMQAHAGGRLHKGHAFDMHEAREMGGALQLGCGDYALHASLQPSSNDVSDESWRVRQIHDGWPWLPNGTSGHYVTASLALQRLDAIFLDKGCYPGQEIVARLHYRGGNKRHLCRVTLSHEVAPGTQLHRSDDDVPLQLLDVIRDGESVEALAIAHETWLTGIDDIASFECAEEIRVHPCEVWSDKEHRDATKVSAT